MNQEIYDKIAHSYDADYYESLEGLVNSIQGKLSRQVYVSGKKEHLDPINTFDPNLTIVYMPSHRSHLDYLVVPKLFHDMGIKTPRILGGSNLLIPGISKPVFGKAIVDFKRAGMVEIDRKQWKTNEDYRETHLQYIDDLLVSGEHLMMFPGGRFYDGMIKDLKIKVISPLFDLNTKKKILVVPVSLTYDRPFEDESFSLQKKINSNPVLEKLKVAYMANIFNGFHTATFAPRGDIYVDFKAPILIDEHMTHDTLIEKLEQEYKSSVRLTPTILVAKAVMEESITQKTLGPSIERLKDALKNRLPFTEEVDSLKGTELAKRGLELLTKGRIVPPLSITSQDVYRPRKVDLFEYYKNHIVHV